MGRFRRRQRVVEAPEKDGVWQVPARFNFTRDVVEAAAADPFRSALTFIDHEGIIDRRTFKEVASDASRWTSLLRSRGLAPGDRVLVLVGRTPAWHAVLLGALKAGLVTVPCSETSPPRDVAFRLEHSGARLVVADRACAPVLEELEVPVEVVVVEDVKDELRTHSILEPTHDTAADDTAFILYTSGTTKDPMGVVHTHGYTWAARLQAKHWLDARPGDLVWSTAGGGSAKSIWNVLLGPWSCGAEVALHEGGFDVEERFELLERLGVTVLCQTPTEYRLMVNHPELERFYLGSIRHAVSAGEPLSPEVITAVRVAFGLTLHDGYGQTENTLLVANAPGTEIRPGSMGLPTPGHEVAVIDDEGNEQPVGVEGDIALRGKPPSLFCGYWDAPDESSAMFRGEWFVTGDRATRDEDGYLWFVGRADDVILSSAYRIGPFEVESALLEHHAVDDCAVVGKPDAERGEIVKAFVVLREGVDPTDELVAELQDQVVSLKAPYMVPRELEFVAELPQTSSGKIRRVELRERDRGAAGLVSHHAPAAATGGEHPVQALPDVLPAEHEPHGEDGRREEKADVEEEAKAEAAAAQAATAAAERSRRDEADTRRAANARAKEERQQRKQDEKQRRAAERAAAEQTRRDEAEARRAAEAKAREDQQQRKEDEKQRRATQRAAAEQARRDEAEARRNAEARAMTDKLRAREARQREAEEAARPPVVERSPDPPTIPEEDAGEVEGRLSPALIARLRAYGHGDDTSEPEEPTE